MTQQKAPKDRGKDTPVATSNDKPEVCPQKFLNIGKRVTLSTGEEWTVKDISLDSWLTSLANALPCLLQFAESAQGKDSAELMTGMVLNSELRNAVYSLVAQAAPGKTLEDVRQLSLADALKVAVAVQEVVDFKEIAELFTQLVRGLNLPHFSMGKTAVPANVKRRS